MRALRILGMTLGGLAGLVVVALLAVWLFVNPNEYKGRIEQAVKGSTGRELDLPGDLELSVFPWIALELGPASLGNPPGFGAEPFASVQHAAFRVKLLPLLHKQLQIGRIEIEGLDLRLRKNAAGKGNWQDIGGNGSGGPSSPDSSRTGSLRGISGIIIKDSRVSYQDTTADHVNLEVGGVTWGATVPVSLQLNLTTSPSAQPIQFAGHFAVSADPAKKQYRFAAVELEAITRAKPDAAAYSWKFSVPNISIDLGAQTLAVPSFTSQVASAHLTGSLHGRQIVDAPVISGGLRLDPVLLRGLMAQLRIEAPETRDPAALAKFAASGAFEYGGNAVRATKLVVQLDESTLRGDAAVAPLDTRALTFNLALDHINVDRYLSRAEASSGNAPLKHVPKAGDSAGGVLKTLQMSGTLAIGSATVFSLNATDMRVGIVAKGGVTRISPATAKLYGGTYSGDVTLDDRGSVPALKLDQTLTSVDVAQLLKDFVKKSFLSGRGTVTTNLTAHGLTSDEITRSLDGHVTANVANGAIEGVDLWFAINSALALLQKQPLPGGSNSGRTSFEVFKASADLSNGVASTKDLAITSQNLHVSGRGTTNLVTEALNYQATVTISKPPANARAAETPLEVPVSITGTMTRPTVRPDLEAMAKARVQQELEKHKGELQRQLQDKLKSIFK